MRYRFTTFSESKQAKEKNLPKELSSGTPNCILLASFLMSVIAYLENRALRGYPEFKGNFT